VSRYWPLGSKFPIWSQRLRSSGRAIRITIVSQLKRNGPIRSTSHPVSASGVAFDSGKTHQRDKTHRRDVSWAWEEFLSSTERNSQMIGPPLAVG
jgi:hypothetical protein